MTFGLLSVAKVEVNDLKEMGLKLIPTFMSRVGYIESAHYKRVLNCSMCVLMDT